jgi:membrane fusion protein, multidrug efflux system
VYVSQHVADFHSDQAKELSQGDSMHSQTSHSGAHAKIGDRGIPMIGGIVLSAALIFFSTGCEKKQEAPVGGAMPVSVVTVHATDVPLRNEWVGTMDGYVNAQIQPQVSGYLIKQDYREGSVVSKGQVLFEIDPRPFQATLDQAQGQVGQAEGALGQAQAQLGLAEINVKRDTPLAEQRAIAQSQLDNDKQTAAQMNANVQAAEAQIATAKAAVENAQLNLGFTQVRSLISGVAGQATTQVGNLVSPQSVLTAVSQMDPIKVYFSISDSEYLSFSNLAGKKNGGMLSSASDLPLTLTLSNGNKYPSKGHIVFVDRQLNAQTGAIRIAAAFPNPGNILRPGQFGRISAETRVQHNVILVPQAAIQELQGTQQAFIVGPGNKVKVVTVTLGPQHGSDWVVEGGLPPGSQVIVDNLQKLREGVPVSPHAAQAPAGNDAAGR